MSAQHPEAQNFSASLSFRYFLLAPLIFGSLWLAEKSLVIEQMENLTVNYRFRWRAPYDPPADPRLVLVGIDEPSINSYGRWPWSRHLHGDLCQLVAVENPAVVAFDILFTEVGDHDEDMHLAEYAGKLPSFISGALAQSEAPVAFGFPTRTGQLSRIVGDQDAIMAWDHMVLPFPALAASSEFGFVNAPPSSADGIRREVPLVVKVGDKIFASLPLKAVMQLYQIGPEDVEVILGQEVRLQTNDGDLRIPINQKGQMLLNYRRPDRIENAGYSALFDELVRRHVQEQTPTAGFPTINGSVLVVGQVADGLADIGPNPLDKMAPLVQTVVTAIDNILQKDYLRVVQGWPLWVGWFATAWASLFLSRRCAISWAVIIPLLLIGLYTCIACWLFATHSLQLPVVVPVLAFIGLHGGFVVARWVEEQLEKKAVTARLEEANRARALMERELQIAKNIQASMLPQDDPPFPDRTEFEIFGLMEPAKSVGGDLYDYFFLDEERLFIVLGDVAGKGVPAALFMAMALSVIRSQATETPNLAEVLRRTNNALAMRNDSCTFVTTFCALLNVKTGQLDYANGGHNGPAFLTGDGAAFLLEEEGTALGLSEDRIFTNRQTVLLPGQSLVLYSDGVTEAFDSDKNMFEVERMLSSLSLCEPELTAEEIVRRLRQDLAAFVAQAPQADDITIVCLKYKGFNSEAQLA